MLYAGAEGVVDDIPPTAVRTPSGNVSGSAFDVHGLPLRAGPVDDPVDYQQRHVSAAVHMPQTDHDVTAPTPECPVEITLSALQGRWTTLVVRELLRGDRSYSELRTALPALSCKALSDRLAQLGQAGVVERDRRRAGRRECATHSPRGDAASAPSSRLSGTGERRRRHEAAELGVAMRRALVNDRPD